MIGHQAICDDRRAVLLIVLFHQLQKILVVSIIEENLSLPRPAIVDVIVLSLCKSITAIWHGYLLTQKRPEGLVLKTRLA
jgi:hypothetical protein